MHCFLIFIHFTIRKAIEMLEEGSNKLLGCSICRQSIARKSDLFNLPGAEGIAGAYVNAHGLVFMIQRKKIYITDLILNVLQLERYIKP